MGTLGMGLCSQESLTLLQHQMQQNSNVNRSRAGMSIRKYRGLMVTVNHEKKDGADCCSDGCSDVSSGGSSFGDSPMWSRTEA